jgi:hypothetical protein
LSLIQFAFRQVICLAGDWVPGLPSKRWRDLILRVWQVDPRRCPVCQNPMRVIAVIDGRLWR